MSSHPQLSIKTPYILGFYLSQNFHDYGANSNLKFNKPQFCIDSLSNKPDSTSPFLAEQVVFTPQPSTNCASQDLSDHSNASTPKNYELVSMDYDSFFAIQGRFNEDQLSSPSGFSRFEGEDYDPNDDLIKDFLLSGISNNSKTIIKTPLQEKKMSCSAKSKAPQAKKRNTWRPEEDQLVLQHIETYGQKWTQIASVMSGRTGKQVRDRYLNVLMPSINKSEWTKAEDAMILRQYEAYGSQWCLIAKYLEGRTEAQVKNRYHTHLKGSFAAASKRTDIKKINETGSLKLLGEGTRNIWKNSNESGIEGEDVNFDLKIQKSMSNSSETSETPTACSENSIELLVPSNMFYFK